MIHYSNKLILFFLLLLLLSCKVLQHTPLKRTINFSGGRFDLYYINKEEEKKSFSLLEDDECNRIIIDKKNIFFFC